MIENNIRKYREKLGMSQVELARRVRMASPNLSAIECGKLAPWPKLRRKLARLLKTTQEDLFPGSQQND